MGKKQLLAVGLFGISFVVLILYYATHKPFTPEVALALGLAAWRVLVGAWLMVLAGGLGQLAWRGDDQPPLVRLALQAGIGLGVFSLVILGIGSTLGIPGWVWWLAPLGLGVLLRRQVLAWLRLWQAVGQLWHASDRFNRWLAGMLGGLFGLMLMVSLAPALHFDSLVYHLRMPQAYLQAGRVDYLPWIVMSGMPQNAEMLLTWCMALGGSEAATTFMWMLGGVSCVGLLGYLNARWDARAAWVGLAALLAGYTPVKLLSGGYVDWLVLLYGFGALVMLEDWRQKGTARGLILAGMFVGLAVGTKYTSLVLATAGLGVLTWHAWQRRQAFIPAGVRFGLAALLCGLPWLLKNWISTSNPFYPFFLGGGEMSALRLSVYQHLPPWGNALDFFLLPLRATTLGIDSGDGYMFSAGPLLLGLGLLAVLNWQEQDAQRGAAVQNAAVLAVLGLGVWALGNQYSGNLIQTRYYFSIFPAFVVLAGAGEYALRRVVLRGVRLERIAGVMILLVLGLNLLETANTVVKQGAVPAVMGIQEQETYLANNLGWFQPAMQAVRSLPEGSKTLLLYEPRSLYCAGKCLPDEIMDRWKRTRPLASVGSIVQAWEAEGLTHVMVYRQGVKFLVDAGDPHHPAEDLEALDQFLARLPEPVRFGGVYELYRLRP